MAISLSSCPSQGSHTQQTLEGYKLQAWKPVSNDLNPKSNKNEHGKWIEERDTGPCQAKVGSRGTGTRQIKNRQQPARRGSAAEHLDL